MTFPVDVDLIPKAGDRYRHFKGGLYAVVCTVRHSEDETVLVIYQNVSTGERWARPLASWNDMVTIPGSSVIVPRFDLLPEDLSVPVPLICKVVRQGKAEVQVPDEEA